MRFLSLSLLFFLGACATVMPGVKPAVPCVPDCKPWKCVPADQKAEMCTQEYMVGGNCYPRYGECKRLADNSCGWAPSMALDQCVAAEKAGIPMKKQEDHPQVLSPKEVER